MRRKARTGALLLLAAAAACTTEADGPALLVASGFTDEVFVLDPGTGATLDQIPLDPRADARDEPHDVAVSPDGLHWYATTAQGDPSLWKYEVDGDRPVGVLSLGMRSAGRIGISPDGRTAVVPDYWLGGGGEISDVAIVDLVALEVRDRIPLCSAPHDAAWSPDGSTVAITCPLSDEIVALDGTTFDELWRTPIPSRDGEYGTPGQPEVQPMDLVWSPDGERIVATLLRSDEIAVLSAAGEGQARAEVGAAPAQLVYTPDGATLIVALRGDWGVAVVDGRSFELRRMIATPEIPSPHGVVLSPDGSRAFVAHEGTARSAGGASAIDLVAGTLLWSRSVGSFNLGIAWRPER